MANKKTKNKIEVSTSENELISFLKIIVVLILVIGLIYGAIFILRKNGILMDGYNKPELTDAVISYEYILAGSTFSKEDKEYYVIYDEYTEKKDEYLYGILYTYEQDEKKTIPVYKVDMANGMNESYKNETSNAKAQTVKDLKINGTTLIKIKNGKNVLYLEGSNNIEKELLK